ncbi:MAG: transglutaminase family protein [Planctomycetota bacterium]|nr:transglutaminase family protein [Planctomycetota bacterium]
MSIRVALHHVTGYKFDRLVSLSPHLIRLWPAPHCRTPILSRSLKVFPEKYFINWQQDAFSNYIARVVFPEMTKALKIEIDLVAEMTVINPFDFFIEETAEAFPFAYKKEQQKELAPFLETLPAGPRLTEWLEHVPKKAEKTVNYIVDLNQRLQKDISYIIRLEPGIQSCEETLTKRSGSCRDSAWLLVQIFRNLGLAARFVSGYLIQLAPDVKSLDGPSGTEVDFTDLHAWTEVYIPGAGWIGLDPTSGLLAGEGHIPLACTADPQNAGPVEGFTDECEAELEFGMKVTRIRETPRVTKPYTPEAWTEIEALGERVDVQLAQDDVRLTMGGEPTFVSIDYPDDDEWNTTAMGPRKRIFAGELIKRLRGKFSPGGLLHYGQGKWYPGESLPRWALSCIWRKDGEPVWKSLDLVANEARDYGVNETHAQRFAQTLARRLDVTGDHIQPGFEDVWYYLLKERRLPVNVDPLRNRLSDPEERKRVAKVFEQGLEKTVGYAMPLQRRWVDGQVRWVTGPWFLRREHLFLLPGDSPMGLRLPLESLPWGTRDQTGYPVELDPLDPRPPLPPRDQFDTFGPHPGYTREAMQRATLRMQGRPGAQRASEEEEARRAAGKYPLPYDVVRTALCVEPRGGHLYVFMPPQPFLEDYLALVAAVEDTAAELKQPVLVEGYPPPYDPRIHTIKVTPDPGVIEVNIHPADSWKELTERTRILYEEARLTRLATEKFMLDGRHTGTGGGNHVILGGAKPSDSPLLRRPDLLRSLLTYWHNHPALSFLFSGLFIGPTSQHPRVDEARNDSLYEVELAFEHLARQQQAQPWLVDRQLRNLLIDCTGNTHRTEFCIDKLYSPDSSSGRLGLVELRSFEMPPHYQMSLAQQLLLRSLVAAFWRKPYEKKLVRWGTEIHDRFMLPHFVEQDFKDVMGDLNEAGFPFQSQWFAPHLEFKFPFIGRFAQQGVQVELRTAIEPWHVLGEEPGAGGTVRYVDSSLERLQVLVTGMTDTRHVVACNGRRLPMHPTGTNGEFVAGLRYRAWQPASCLHPTIPVHTPLAFDLVDTWNERSVGGCTYHVAHPGGRNYTTFPVNAYEAESRRAARFFVHGHTHGKVAAPAEERTREFPLTLDLRTFPG